METAEVIRKIAEKITHSKEKPCPGIFDMPESEFCDCTCEECWIETLESIVAEEE